jgi:hypothetical protein
MLRSKIIYTQQKQTRKTKQNKYKKRMRTKEDIEMICRACLEHKT